MNHDTIFEGFHRWIINGSRIHMHTRRFACLPTVRCNNTASPLNLYRDLHQHNDRWKTRVSSRDGPFQVWSSRHECELVSHLLINIDVGMWVWFPEISAIQMSRGRRESVMYKNERSIDTQCLIPSMLSCGPSSWRDLRKMPRVLPRSLVSRKRPTGVLTRMRAQISRFSQVQ